MSNYKIAFVVAIINDLESGLAKCNILFGKIYGTPPTFVLTTDNPHDAAYKIAIQKDYVNEELIKIWPLTKTSRTSAGCTAPNNWTRELNLYF